MSCSHAYNNKYLMFQKKLRIGKKISYISSLTRLISVPQRASTLNVICLKQLSLFHKTKPYTSTRTLCKAGQFFEMS